MERFVEFISERESIRIKKEAGAPRPWTSNPILEKYKFCNVRRMDDRVSRWLTENWYGPNQGSPSMFLACATARQINWPESLEAIGFPHRWEPNRFHRILQKRKEQGKKVYTGAYMLTGTLGGTKLQQTIFKILDPLSDIPPPPTTTMKEAHSYLVGRAGFGLFMAGQVVADLRWAVPGEWGDRDTWAPRGPGSKRGLNRLLGRPLREPVSEQFFVEHCSEVLKEVKKVNPLAEMMDAQNCLCEFDKYLRVMENPKSALELYK